MPDGDWSLVLTAPSGGVKGAISTFKSAVSHIGSVLGSTDTISLTSFGGCVEEGGGEGNKTASCEDVSGSQTESWLGRLLLSRLCRCSLQLRCVSMRLDATCGSLDYSCTLL